jgi:hypothetical protein
MNNPLRSADDYELFIYTLAERYSSIRSSTLIFERRGSTLARVAGEIILEQGFRIVVRERIIFDRLPAHIEWYGYEIWHGEQKLYWYDSQPHPDDATLQSTHPHHKHVPPDIKHNRIPAPAMSFTRPNLPAVIREVEQTLALDT